MESRGHVLATRERDFRQTEYGSRNSRHLPSPLPMSLPTPKQVPLPEGGSAS